MDKLTIINRALMRCGLKLAASLNDCDYNAHIIYEDVKRECLRSFAWGFAMRFSVFGRAEADPAFGYSYAYRMPEDCCRVVDVRASQDIRAPRAEYTTAGKLVYTNASPCNARYVSFDIDPDDWPLDFASAVSSRIAWEIAALSAESMNLVAPLMQQFAAAMQLAQINDSREQTARASTSRFSVDVRNGGE